MEQSQTTVHTDNKARELSDLILAIIRHEVQRAPNPPQQQEDIPLTLTINQVRKLYGIGRSQLDKLIKSGDLPATPRIMRGGRTGYVIKREDAHRVLAGGYSSP